ncbi:DUF5701 family protein [Herbiconiux sp.]|jgi:hypothetical protein|uniref:DUF5701 family protein n=1 Tax=Herbiconiux sp. TaxID=1871186 RepID=UPI0025C66269|nr:DUF5701 family protein [Herbiconiux sp.]
MSLITLSASAPPTPTVSEQLDRLVALGLPEVAGISPEELRSHAAGLRGRADSVLVVNPCIAPPSALATLLMRESKRGFVVDDFTDLDDFVPLDGLALPDAPLYLVHGIERGDDLANLSPDEALPLLRARERRPLTVSEGISWLLQQPDALQPNHCFMTIGSRRGSAKNPGTLDARTPAIWISGGTGRDGRRRRGAPKVGWCWAGNRHTWLGFASTPA